VPLTFRMSPIFRTPDANELRERDLRVAAIG